MEQHFPGYYVCIRNDTPPGDCEIKCGFVCGDVSNNPLREFVNFTGSLVIANYPKEIYAGYQAIWYCNSTQVPCKFIKFIRRTDRPNGRKGYENPELIQKDDLGVVVIKPLEPISMEVNDDYLSLGRFVVQNKNRVVAVGRTLKV